MSPDSTLVCIFADKGYIKKISSFSLLKLKKKKEFFSLAGAAVNNINIFYFRHQKSFLKYFCDLIISC